MNDNKKTYWKGIEQLSNDPEFVKNADKEFPEFLPINKNSEEGGGSSRRDFLKMMGFGIAAVSLAACEAPVRKAIPYVNKPVDVDPGIPNYYASAYTNGGDYCGILVKTREGRPIKIEGNSLCEITAGGTSAQVQASVLTLYDNERLIKPVIGGKEGTWEALDKEVTAKLRSIAAQGGQIRIVSNTILSPTTKQVIEDFKAQYPTAQHVTYDAVSAHGILAANQESFGQRVLPRYDFSKAEVIVSFAADFLGTWISPVEYSKQYAKTRKIGPKKQTMSRHYQFESLLSMTGANADYRTRIKASDEGKAVVALYEAITANKSADIQHINKVAAELKKARGKSLVVSGSNDPEVQLVVNAINSTLNNYGTTIDLSTPAYYKQGDDAEMAKFVNDVKGGKIGGVIFYNCNPVYNYKGGVELAEALKKVSLKVSTADRPDETAAVADYVAPDHHFLESWNDAEPRQGYFAFVQPTITPIFNTRQAQESLLKWSGVETPDYYTYLKDAWAAKGLTGTSWDKVLHDGIYATGTSTQQTTTDTADGDTTAAAGVVASFSGDISRAVGSVKKTQGSGVELVLYQKVGIGDGSQANNPWLQEMPDPVTKATWDNYLSVSQKWAEANDVKYFEGKCNVARITANGVTAVVPILIQPGQADETVGLALGYGRLSGGKVANNRGVDAYPFVQVNNGVLNYQVLSGVTVEVLPEMYQIAKTQTHQTYMGRETVIQESVLAEYQANPFAGRHDPKIATWLSEEGGVHPGAISLWKGHKFNNHHWGMAIDLNSCTGCSACTIACQAENNVPVVGKAEVINRRDMHWLRIDRYYSSDADANDLKGLEEASANPEVTFQPMLCQHCNNAPCETVCPVAATTHSTEGLNQMTYNRCIGTRYCANNCPYKVRRFNWFKYHDNENFEDVNTSMNNDLGKMVLNPDVTVRSRGVMEKCSFCVQRIQYGKLEAKKEGRRPKDGDVTTACASACPTEAIVFGDMNDADSRIYKLLDINDTDGPDYITEKEILEPRAYHVIGEVGTKPNISYLTKIRNRDIEDTKA